MRKCRLKKGWGPIHWTEFGKNKRRRRKRSSKKKKQLFWAEKNGQSQDGGKQVWFANQNIFGGQKHRGTKEGWRKGDCWGGLKKKKNRSSKKKPDEIWRSML